MRDKRDGHYCVHGSHMDVMWELTGKMNILHLPVADHFKLNIFFWSLHVLSWLFNI